MKIAILAHGNRTAGGLSVARNVFSSLSRVGAAHDYLLVMPTGAGYEAGPLPSRREELWFTRRMGPLWRGVFDTAVLPARLQAFQPDAVWGLAGLSVRAKGAVQAVLHMRPHALYPREHAGPWSRLTQLDNAVFERRLRALLPTIDLVFCQTDAAASRYRERLGYRGRIAIMPAAVSETTLTDEGGEAPFVRRPGEFVLFSLTRYYAHKGLERIVDMFERFRDELRGVRVILTIARGDAPPAGRLLDRIAERGLGDRFENVGPVPQEALGACFRAADAVLFPTMLESFSMTYLEAMHFGTPILTSDLDFAHAVCADAARYFDPFDAASMRDAVLALRGDPAEQARLVAAGHARRRGFVRSWDAIVADALTEIEAVRSAR
jgi:glycosyltransferase involved in cell wall biosynthesis